jgi:hypothetical protein
MTDNTDQPFEEIFGPLAPYSDYKVGDTITYRSPDGPIRRGEIMWIEPPGRPEACLLFTLIAISLHPLDFDSRGRHR